MSRRQVLYQESTSLVVVLDFTKSLLYTVKLPVKGTAKSHRPGWHAAVLTLQTRFRLSLRFG